MKLCLQRTQPDGGLELLCAAHFCSCDVCQSSLLPACLVTLFREEQYIYDNPGMRRTPHAAVKGKSDMDPEEDIYGGFGEGEEGIYDLTTGGGRGMKHSEEGIYSYDNPHAKG